MLPTSLRDRPRADAPESGFTILEIMISMVVLLFGLMGLMQAMMSAWKLDQQANEKRIAINFMTAKMEEIRSMRFSDIERDHPVGFLAAGLADNWPSWPYEPPGPYTYTPPAMNAQGFRWKWDGDADRDYFGLFYSWDTSGAPAVNKAVQDSRLAGLAPQPGYLYPQPGANRVAEVTFRDPYPLAWNTGMDEGEGYYCRIRVFWRGVAGDTEVSMYTFLTKRQ